jgi:hypothetical protein
LRGTPRLGRILALPTGSLAVAVLGGGLACTVLRPDRWLAVAVASAAIFGVYELVRAQRLLARQRRVADDWLRTATTGFVPPSHAWRAEQLLAPRHRRLLARTLRLIEQSAYERPLGRRRPLYLPAVREHRCSVQFLARALDNVEEPVTPAGMLRVVELITDGASPLWGTAKDAELGNAIAETLAILSPSVLESARCARAAA